MLQLFYGTQLQRYLLEQIETQFLHAILGAPGVSQIKPGIRSGNAGDTGLVSEITHYILALSL